MVFFDISRARLDVYDVRAAVTFGVRNKVY